MAQLTQIGNEFFKIDDDGNVSGLSKEDFVKQRGLQEYTQTLGFGDQLGIGIARSIKDMASGVRQLTYGDEGAEIAQRAQREQALAPLKEYSGPGAQIGGFGLGEFAGSAATAAIPGGLGVQTGIGAAQGAAEMPNSPWLGAGIGVAGTLAGDYAGRAINRMANTLGMKRESLNAAYNAKLARGQELGLEFTPGQRANDPTRKRLEHFLGKQPQYAGIDADRFVANQAKLNDLAAGYLGQTPTGSVSDDMIDSAYQVAKDGFKVVDNYEGPITLEKQRMIQAADDMSDTGQAFYRRFMKRYPGMFKNKETSGKQFMQARNWLAKQSRNQGNMQQGIGDDINSLIGAMDQSLENSVDEVTASAVRRARSQWKSMLVVENSFGGMESAQKGQINPLSAARALKKYYGREFTQGRVKDPFIDAVRAMTAAGDNVIPNQVSPNKSGKMFDFLADPLMNQPIAEGYMKGENPLYDILMGMTTANPDRNPLLEQLGRGGARGLMDFEDNKVQ